MTDKIKSALLAILLLVAVGGLLFYIGYTKGRNGAISAMKPKVDTLYQRETLRLFYPHYIEKKVVEEVKVEVRDTIRERDTLFMSLPKEQKTYKSAEYMAIVSGIFPSLDYIETYSLTTTITKTITEPRKKIGFSVGVGPSVIWSPWKGVDGGVGVFGGLTYTF